jgi:SAM-dependent methyltransferase
VESRQVARFYDAVADAYAARLFGELADKPLDRALLDRFAELTRGRGPVCDLGCGPGQIARYLRDRGAPAFGADLSEASLREARRLSPDIPFQRHDMLALGLRSSALAGVAAFYAIVHCSDEQLARALDEIARVLGPGGHLLLSFHVGEGVHHVDELFGRPAAADFRFFAVDPVAARIRAAGLDLVETTLREPYPDVEAQTRRAYLLARRPG